MWAFIPPRREAHIIPDLRLSSHSRFFRRLKHGFPTTWRSRCLSVKNSVNADANFEQAAPVEHPSASSAEVVETLLYGCATCGSSNSDFAFAYTLKWPNNQGVYPQMTISFFNYLAHGIVHREPHLNLPQKQFFGCGMELLE